MSEFEKQEALWDTENGMANRTEEHTEVPVEAVTEDVEDDFEIPDIPAVFPMPEQPEQPFRPIQNEQPLQTGMPPVQEPHVWNSRTIKQQVKDTKKKYRLEKKRLRKEKRMRGPGWKKVLVTGLLCALIGSFLGTAITISVLSLTSQVFHIDLLDLKPEQIEVIREQYVARIQDYKSPGTAVYKKNCSSVVYVQTSGGKTDSVWESQTGGNSTASGVVYREDGYVLTNISAIRNALQSNGTLQQNASIIVYLAQDSDTAYPASLVGYDWKTDVALLHIDATELYAVEFGDSEQVQPGDTIFTMYYADSPDALQMKESIVSSLRPESFRVDCAEEQAWNHSPLFSVEGKFIGLNSTNEEEIIAIPSDRIEKACNQILDREKK